MENNKGMIYVVGIGPGRKEAMTADAWHALEESSLIVGYKTYIDLIRDFFPQKEFRSAPMRQETARCRMVLEEAERGRTVSLISSGDAGVYGMAGLMLQMAERYPELSDRIRVVPGITAALSGAAVLGSPLTNDFCTISLSDLLTPAEEIERRLRGAAAGDFVIVLYNPSSRHRQDYLEKACHLLMEAGMPGSRPCGYVKNIGREGESAHICTLEKLAGTKVDMSATVFIGNSHTKMIGNRLVTPRGYSLG